MKNTDLNIENRASCLLGRQLEAHDEQLLRQLCADAQVQLKTRLRRGVNAEDIVEVFESACALYAAAMLLELKGGGVSLHGGQGLGAARRQGSGDSAPSGDGYARSLHRRGRF